MTLNFHSSYIKHIRSCCVLSAWTLLFSVPLQCKDSYVMFKEDAAEKGASIRLHKFKRESTNAIGKMKWAIEAEEAFVFRKDQSESRISAYRFKFTDYSAKGDVSGSVVADKGEIDYGKQKLHLTGKVEYVSADGKDRVSGTKIVYDLTEKIMTSVDPVVIIHGDMMTTCKAGAVVYTALKREICRNPVGVRFKMSRDDKSKQESGNIFQ